MGHLCHIFLGPPSVDGHWVFSRVVAMATSAAVRTVAYGPLDLSEVCFLRVCTQDGLVLSQMRALFGPHEIPGIPHANHHHHRTLSPQQWHTRDWTLAPDEWGLGSLWQDGGSTLFRPGPGPVWHSISVAHLPAP